MKNSHFNRTPLYLLSEISKFVPKEHHGVYRDDGLLALPENAGEHERIKKKLVKLFKDNGFSIEAQINMKQVDFLDANLNMKTREFKKENSEMQYVRKDSNHWSKTIEGIEGRKQEMPTLYQRETSNSTS